MNKPLMALCSGIALGTVFTANAQLGPEPRQLLHLGVNQSLHNAGMLFQYNFGRTGFASARAFEELRGLRVPVR